MARDQPRVSVETAPRLKPHYKSNCLISIELLCCRCWRRQKKDSENRSYESSDNSCNAHPSDPPKGAHSEAPNASCWFRRASMVLTRLLFDSGIACQGRNNASSGAVLNHRDFIGRCRLFSVYYSQPE